MQTQAYMYIAKMKPFAGNESESEELIIRTTLAGYLCPLLPEDVLSLVFAIIDRGPHAPHSRMVYY